MLIYLYLFVQFAKIFRRAISLIKSISVMHAETTVGATLGSIYGKALILKDSLAQFAQNILMTDP